MTIEKESRRSILGFPRRKEVLPKGHMELIERLNVFGANRYISRMIEVVSDDEICVTMHTTSGDVVRREYFTREEINDARIGSIVPVNKSGDAFAYGTNNNYSWKPTSES